MYPSNEFWRGVARKVLINLITQAIWPVTKWLVCDVLPQLIKWISGNWP